MRLRNSVFIGGFIAILLHLLLGWQFSVLGGIAAGYLCEKGSVWAGTNSLVLGWGALILYNFVVAGAETLRMIELMAHLLGGLPGFVTVTMTLFIGALLGSVSGWVGAALNSKK